MIRNLPRRLEASNSARILFVNREKGLTGVVRLETGKPPTSVPATSDDEEWVRNSLKGQRER